MYFHTFSMRKFAIIILLGLAQSNFYGQLQDRQIITGKWKGSAPIDGSFSISNKVYYGTIDISKAGLGVHPEPETAQEKPGHTALLGSYPNPFNPTTTVAYQLAMPGYVRLSIYNILGEEIARLADGDHAEGYYSAAWDAGIAPSGIYYARITVMNPSRNELYQSATKLLFMK